MSFTEIQQKLSDLYGGAASANAETFQGKIDRLKVGFDEAKESLGVALLPQVERFISFLNETGIPTLNAFIAGLTGDKGLSAGLNETQRSAENFGKGISAVAGIISGFITFLREAIGLVISLANEMIRVANIIPGVNIGSIPNIAPSANMAGIPEYATSANTRESRTTNITIQGAVDPVSTARQVAQIINKESSTSGTLGPLGQIGFYRSR